VDMRVGVGYSFHAESREAARRAARRAVEQSGRPVLTFLFTTAGYSQEEILETVTAETGTAKLAGAAGGGIITAEGVKRRGVEVITLAGESLRAHTALVSISSRRPDETGRRLAELLLNEGCDAPGTVFLFPDGLAGNTARILRGVYDILGPRFNYAGGGTGDGLHAAANRQITEAGVTGGAVAAALLTGCSFATGLEHGYEPFGPPLLLTKTNGKMVFEIDEQPAFQVYSRLLGGIADREFYTYAARHPLGILDSTGNAVIRDPFRLGADGSMEFVSEVPSHAVAHLMRCTTRDGFTRAARRALARAEKSLPSPRCALIFNCLSRFTTMKQQIDRELKTIRGLLGEVPLAGFLSLGEVGNYAGGPPLWHNKTFLIALGGVAL